MGKKEPSLAEPVLVAAGKKESRITLGPVLDIRAASPLRDGLQKALKRGKPLVLDAADVSRLWRPSSRCCWRPKSAEGADGRFALAQASDAFEAAFSDQGPLANRMSWSPKHDPAILSVDDSPTMRRQLPARCARPATRSSRPRTASTVSTPRGERAFTTSSPTSTCRDGRSDYHRARPHQAPDLAIPMLILTTERRRRCARRVGSPAPPAGSSSPLPRKAGELGAPDRQ